MVPPMSATSFCSGRRSITGNGVSGSNSVEFAPSMPETWRGHSRPANCMPRANPRDVARDLRHRDLHAEADAQVGHAPLAREAGRADLALDSAHSEAARDEDA